MGEPVLEPWEQTDPWEDASEYNGGWGEDSELEDSDNCEAPNMKKKYVPTKTEAADRLGEYLIERVLIGKMTAKEACIVAFWAKHSGVGGGVCQLALDPQSPTGNFKRRFNEVIGAADFDNRVMPLNIPGHSGSSMSRVVYQDWFF